MLRSIRSLPFALFLCALILPLAGGCQSGGSDSATSEDTGPPPLPDDEVAVENPWVRPAAAGESTALYLTIANGTNTPDTLVDVEAPIIGGVEMHESQTDTSNMTSMTPIETMAAPGSTRTTLAPGGTHVMLTNLGQSLDSGSTVILTLDFAQSGLQRIQAPVQNSPPSDAE